MILDSITVMVGGIPFVSTRDAADSGVPHIVGDVQVKWSRATSLSPPDPQDINFTVRMRRTFEPANDPIGLDDPVLLTVVVGGISAEVFGGVVDSIRYEAAPLGEWQDIKVGAICHMARAARRRVGSEPWPRENLRARFPRLNALVPEVADPPTPNSTQQYFSAIPMDIDARNPIEVLQEHWGIINLFPYGAANGIRSTKANVSLIRRLNVRIQYDQVTITDGWDTIEVVNLPAKSIENVGRELSFDSVVSAVTINFTLSTLDGEYSRETSRTYGSSSTPGTSMSFTTAEVLRVSNVASQTEFDAVQPGDPHGYDTQRALDDDPTPQYRLDPLTVYFEDIPTDPAAPLQPADLAALVGLDSRWSTVLVIEGAPPDIYPLHVATSGALTLSGDASRCKLTVTPEPTTFVNEYPLATWDSIDIPTDYWYSRFKWPKAQQVTWREMASIHQINVGN